MPMARCSRRLAELERALALSQHRFRWIRAPIRGARPGACPYSDAKLESRRASRAPDRDRRRMERHQKERASAPWPTLRLEALRSVEPEYAASGAHDFCSKPQAYRLAYWRVASDDINYRRFFDVNALGALRVENEAVFEATHKLALELVAPGKDRRPARRSSRRPVQSGGVFPASAEASRRVTPTRAAASAGRKNHGLLRASAT